jgi:hypothetical protein
MSSPAAKRDITTEPLPSDAALAAFPREVKESGMTDDELRGYFEELRDEVYQERHGGSRRTNRLQQRLR